MKYLQNSALYRRRNPRRKPKNSGGMGNSLIVGDAASDKCSDKIFMILQKIRDKCRKT